VTLPRKAAPLLRIRSLRLRVVLTVMLAAVVPMIYAAQVEKYDQKALIRLALVVLPAAGLLSLWLAWRILRPLEALRAQALEMAPRPYAQPNLKMQRKDEFGDLAEALNTLLAALEERQKQNAHFVADLAHEFKNPVAAIRAAAEALGNGPVDAKRAERLSGILQDSSRRLDALVTQFLDLARAEAGMPNEQRSHVDLRALASGILDSARTRHEGSGIRFELEAGEAVTVDGVSGRLESVIRNLVDNAASFAGQDGWVKVSVDAPYRTVRVRVADSGPGIPQENLPRMFERFFTTRSAGGKGSGLGLALVKAIVEAHGGRVGVQSPQGQGAIFEVHIPRAR